MALESSEPDCVLYITPPTAYQQKALLWVRLSFCGGRNYTRLTGDLYKQTLSDLCVTWCCLLMKENIADLTLEPEEVKYSFLKFKNHLGAARWFSW